MKSFNTVGLVIPCYNEAERLDVGKFISFLSGQDDIHIIFVNDGSKDHTIDVLKNIENVVPNQASVVDMEQNGGKAEAVRQGVLYALNHLPVHHIGFLDADLATTLEEMEQMVEFAQRNSYYQVVMGSRMTRIGANITRKFSRKVFSAVVGMMIQTVSQLPVNDTQCGAKLFSREIAEQIFADSFKSDWLFDVELLVRIRQTYGKNYATQRIYEYPLMQWINADGSKVGLKEIYRTPIMIAKIGLLYHLPIETMIEGMGSYFAMMSQSLSGVEMVEAL